MTYLLHCHIHNKGLCTHCRHNWFSKTVMSFINEPLITSLTEMTSKNETRPSWPWDQIWHPQCNALQQQNNFLSNKKINIYSIVKSTIPPIWFSKWLKDRQKSCPFKVQKWRKTIVFLTKKHSLTTPRHR